MKKLLIVTCMLVVGGCKKNEDHQAKDGERYKDAIFSGVIKATVQYDVQPDYLKQPTVLLADVYQPDGDIVSARPAIIYVHGGGFTGGTKDGGQQIYFLEALAKKGYVVASIEYRLGYSANIPEQVSKATLRAIQDLNSFIRFAKQNAASYRVDTTKIFLCGSSAGGATVLAGSFLDYDERPSFLDTAGVGSFEGKGNLNGHSAKAKAVYSMWGAVADTLWITAGDIPVGAIQSINDPCIPWNTTASSCQFPGYPTFGSNAIYSRAKNLGIYSTVYSYNSSQHDLGLNFPHIDTTILQMSEFFLPLVK